MVTDDAERSALLEAGEVGMVEVVRVPCGMVEGVMISQDVEFTIVRLLARLRHQVQQTIGERSSSADIRKFATKDFTNRSSLL
jgi:hypothetical protein